MKLKLGQLVKIIIEEEKDPLLAIVTKKHDNGDYELSWNVQDNTLSDTIPHHKLIEKFSKGHYKLVLD
jgi:hypothetical protein|tara:strand:+ start:1349 stop:1552 length:204 start_codon:yes stop_codon:yes gene_type:complete